MSFTVGIIIHKMGRYREIIWLGNMLTLLGMGLYIDLNTDSSLGKLIAYQVVSGSGTGMLFFAPLLALHTNVSQGDTATATATFGFIRNIATSASVVIGGAIFKNSMTSQQAVLISAGMPKELADEFTGTSAAANVLRIARIENPDHRRAIQDAFSNSMKNIWCLYTAMAAVGVISCLCIRTNVMSKQHTEHKTGLRKELKK